MQKKGQFYLLSAIVIIAILIGFSTISTYTKRESVARVLDISEELEIESANVIDYGTYPVNKDKVGNLDDFLTEFVDDYAEYIGEDKEISFVFGNPEDDELTVVNYEEVVTFTVSDISSLPITERTSYSEDYDITKEEGGSVTTIKFKDRKYKIRLKPGENFYFVISQDIGEERHTTKSREVEEVD
jgi:hypothetical protein